MPYLIINNNHRQPPYWSVPWAFQRAAGMVQIGGWERDSKLATRYDDRTEAENVIGIRSLNAKVIQTLA